MTVSMSEKALNTAARALYEAIHGPGGWGAWIDEEDRRYHEYAQAAASAYLDSLLGDLPDREQWSPEAQTIIEEFVRSLRGGLGGGA